MSARLYVDGWIDADGIGHDLRPDDWTVAVCGQAVHDGQVTYTEATCRACGGHEPLVVKL